MIVFSVVVAAIFMPFTYAIQSNRTCVPKPKDMRQIVCHCSRSLQLRCIYNPEILLMDAKYLDESLRPIFYDDVSLDRLADPDDQLDPNVDFAARRVKYAGNRNKFYLYFPNFELMNTPYMRITMAR